jgi:hypothetical protein
MPPQTSNTFVGHTHVGHNRVGYQRVGLIYVGHVHAARKIDPTIHLHPSLHPPLLHSTNDTILTTLPNMDHWAGVLDPMRDH